MTEIQAEQLLIALDELNNAAQVSISLQYITIFVLALFLGYTFFKRGGS